jgi:hypothetical protein
MGTGCWIQITASVLRLLDRLENESEADNFDTVQYSTVHLQYWTLFLTDRLTGLP